MQAARGTARRAALDDALAEIESGLPAPSARWKVKYGLMLGLERVLTDEPPRTAAGTELRRHQVDALAGMLAELILGLGWWKLLARGATIEKPESLSTVAATAEDRALVGQGLADALNVGAY